MSGGTVKQDTATLARQDGVALVVAIGALLVIGVVAAGAALIAVNAKQQTGRDRASAQALTAAESGLQLGTYYLNQSAPIADGFCPGTATVTAQTAAVSGQCGPYSVSLPNGGSVSFTISGGSTSPLACSGAQVNSPTRPNLAVHQRCITATGTFATAVRRAQARVASVSFIFPLPGILGLQNVKIGQGAGSTLPLSSCTNPDTLPSGSSLVMGSVGTNGTLTTSLNCWVGDRSDVVNGNTSRLYMGLGAPTVNGNNPNPFVTGAQPGGIVNLAYKLALPSVDPLFQLGRDGLTDVSLPAGNNNGTGIRIGLSGGSSTCSGPPYDSVTRVLNLPNNGCSVTLDGSTDIDHPNVYDFCGITLPNNGALSVTDPANAPYVQVYLDSPARRRADGTAACANGSGTLTMGNGSSILANATTSLGAQIFIYGTADADGTNGNSIAWRNSADVKMLLVAPKARIVFQNGGKITGGLAAWSVEANNNMVFIWDETVDHVQRRALYYRTSYTECAKAPTVPTDPHSGC